MDEEFPLSLPIGATVVSLPWVDQDAEMGQGVGDQGWLVEAPTSGTAATTWCFGKFTFGRHLALHRYNLWWLKPSHGTSGLEVPPETSLLLAERRCSDGSKAYVALLPLSGTHARCCLHRPGDGNADDDPSVIALSADTGDAATPLPERLGILLAGTGAEPFRLVRKLVQEATRRVRCQLLLECEAEAPGDADTSAPAPGFVDTFGWCTWDSFYTMVSPEGIMKGLATLNERGVRPRWVIIDDGWQSTTNDDALNTEQWDERLEAIEANKRFRRFNEEGELVLDLGDTVGKMKKNFGVDKVLAWHAMSGYWAGVEPTAEGMAPFQPRLAHLIAPEGIREVDPKFQPELDQKPFGMIPADRVESFYLSYHKYLKDNGVDGVKVDVQSMLDCMGVGNGGAPGVTRAYHAGLARSVEVTFKEGDDPAALIHCMCHAPLVLLHIACESRDRAVIRGSGDYYPREDASHGPHLYMNAYNAIFLSILGVQDWDMFQTAVGRKDPNESSIGGEDAEGGAEVAAERTEACWFHAAARAISGGPVYVSDHPGQHNNDILAKLVLEDGSVLRATTNALPTLDCLMRDPQADGGGLLQIWAINKLPGTGVVGSFNIRGCRFMGCFTDGAGTWVRLEEGSVPAVKGTVAPADVHAFDAGKKLSGEVKDEDYALFLHCRKEARVVGLRDAVEIEILPMRYELATFSRILELGSSQEGMEPLRWAPIGLAEMFNSSAAITKQEQVIPRLTDSQDEAKGQGQPGHQKGGNATVELKLSIRGSGKFLGLASRRPTRAALQCSVDGESAEARVTSDEVGVSFSTLAESGGKHRMEVVEVDISGPWDGRDRSLVLSWA